MCEICTEAGSRGICLGKISHDLRKLLPDGAVHWVINFPQSWCLVCVPCNMVHSGRGKHSVKVKTPKEPSENGSE